MTLSDIYGALPLIVESGLVLAGLLSILIWVRDRTRRISYLRLFVQTISLLVIFATVLILSQWNWLVLDSILLSTVFFGRFFCGWICPLGFYLDLTTYAQRLVGVRHLTMPRRVNDSLQLLRYFLACMVLIFPITFGLLQVGVWVQFALMDGPFKPLIIYFLGPLEPLVLPYSSSLLGGYSLGFPYIRAITVYLGGSLVPQIAVWALVLSILVSAFLYRRCWCRFCPTGVSIAVLNRFKGLRWMPLFHLNKVEEKCTKCGICDRVCPVQVTQVYEQKGGMITTSMCNVCLRCLEMCPYEGCLTFDVGGRTIVKSRNWLEPFKGE
jgi:ferredoxin-type protein NapH